MTIIILTQDTEADPSSASKDSQDFRTPKPSSDADQTEEPPTERSHDSKSSY